MADYVVGSDANSESESLEEGSTADLPSFKISLAPTGDAGSGFRTQNDPSAPYQRSNYVERKGAVDVRCRCLDVIHGLFSLESEAFATLIVLEFRFDARKHAQRFKSVDIALEFEGMKAGESGPEVYRIAPDGRMSLVPTTEHEEVKRNASLQLGGAAPVGGLTAAGVLGWEKSVSRHTHDQTTVVGSIDLKGRNWGKSNSASWTLLENGTTKTGVPTLLKTAVLLKRTDKSPFQCVVKIDATLDLWSRLGRVFGGIGRTPTDDPVLFDPVLPPTNQLQTYEVEALGAFDLESVCDVTFGTTLDRAG